MENTLNHGEFCGYITSPPVFSHENHGRRFYRFQLTVPRLSGTEDQLPVIAAQELLECAAEGEAVTVTGQLRTFNSRLDTGRKLIISVFAETLLPCCDEPRNAVILTGSLCKEPILRRTPLGRDICDLMLAVPRRHRRTDYIPCILWGRTAQETAALPIGSKVELHGRFQSRNYLKVLENATEERTAYEVSVMEAYLLPEISP